MASKGGEWREALPLFVEFDTERSTHHATIENTPTYSHDMIEKLVFCRTGPYLTLEAGDHRAARTPPWQRAVRLPPDSRVSRGLEVRLDLR